MGGEFEAGSELPGGNTRVVKKFSRAINHVVAFLAYHHAERNHQGLANKLIEPGEGVGSSGIFPATIERSLQAACR